jgi:hypothetical protein
MSREGLLQLVDRWVNEPAFRAELRADPEAAVRNSGVELSEQEMSALRNVDWSLSDEELESRVSKTLLGAC